MKIPSRRAALVAAVTGFFLTAASWLFATDRPATDQSARTLVPVFSPALDGPIFEIEFTNDTDRLADILELLQESQIVLDEMKYDRAGVKFVGNSKLAVGQTHRFEIDLGSYIPGWQRQGESKKLNRWRWKTPLGSGEHEIELDFGGKKYGPVTFRWNGDVPLLYE
jgi:hypothetical protein